MKLFDAHCHLQDPRIINEAGQLISEAVASGVYAFAVNGTSEKDWDLVKEMGEEYPSVIPCFGLHPWFIVNRTPCWFDTLKNFFETTPTAAVGEIGLDKSPNAGEIDFSDQVVVFRPQLELAKELKKPVAVHCLDAFDDLIEIMKSVGPFPSGVILHSYAGSAEIVPQLAELGSYFSFSGWLTYTSKEKAKEIVKAVPSDRILLETDCPDGLPKVGDPSSLQGHVFLKDGNSAPKETINVPENIHIVLDYVANLLEMEKEELAKLSYRNAVRLFSYAGSKLPSDR
ncbi:PREDICTED: uncharacterized protein LOC104802900 [Tarenaya hassleriana]|uniref:uncharacterized protein LOC104802900 n=1 Tax=Tarenaya hassleriana TaxID=28532 RepID=UPI0008FD2F9E|nr:PREDICTED: uncharacterized protein LOC104802900 [Tarenaya hassleriana]